ncbi:FAD-binding protein [Blastomonas sp. AAP53]|uniref:FAD-binding protein n=1 Tax=Blastomonas sp. AAP53 TaxID=1248760 RepID=UPI0002DDBFB5|nr:FAD-binding protein [Blastomonas sp. AAP53]
MPAPLRHGPRHWVNYHGTESADLSDLVELQNSTASTGRAVLRDVAHDVLALLQQARQAGQQVRPLGAGWSPSPISVVQGGWLVETRNINRCFRLTARDVAPGRDASCLMLVQAGATVDEVNDSAEELGLSLRTGGASNGQTWAGACATGTHGSVLAAGGIQDHVRALQVVTPSGVFWVEPHQPVMSPDFVGATGSTIFRDDDVFAACQVAVGAMGFVTAMVIECVPIYMVRNIQKRAKLARGDITRLANGDFRGFSRALALDEQPHFVQVILNPFAPFTRDALLRLLYLRDFDPGIPPPPRPLAGAGHDALTLIGKAMAGLDLFRADVLQLAMRAGYATQRDISDPEAVATWGHTTEPHNPIANLFNGSVTMARSDLERAFDPLIEAFLNGGGGTVVTLRFMQRAAGLLAPARFENNVVIDFDGPRSDVSHRSYRAVVARLDAMGIRFTRHWGKTNDLDAARVASDYGDDYRRFRLAQRRLLADPGDIAVFRSDPLVHLGLID